MTNVLERLRNLVPYRQAIEARLITAAQRGDRKAFDALWCMHERPLRDFVARRIRHHVLDTVLQQTWLAGWSALPQYRRRPRFRAWIFSLALHKCDLYARTQARNEVEARLEAAEDRDLSPPDGDRAPKAGKIDPAMLAQLPAEQQDVLDLYYGAELTLAEVAQVLNRKPDMVKSLFYRAHALIAQQHDLRAW